MAKSSGGFPLQYRPLIAKAFERGAVARMSIHDQAHRLTVKRLDLVDSCYVSPFCKVRSYVIPEVHNMKNSRWAVSDVTAGNYFYRAVFLACSIGT